MLSYLSGSDENRERAASVMGVGWWRRFRYGILPLIALRFVNWTQLVTRAGAR